MSATPAQVDAMVDALQPDVLLNCSAFNRVDEAEDAPEAAFAVNTFAVRNLALAARRRNAKLMHFSSDYVFDGPGRTPYVETDLPCPQSMYGVSKLAGEAMAQAIWPKHFLIRTCGLYGYTGSRDKGTNFVEAMLRVGAKGGPVRVVNDQFCTPTSTMDLARAVARLLPTEGYGLYHLTSAGECSWYEFANAIFDEAGLASGSAAGNAPTSSRRKQNAPIIPCWTIEDFGPKVLRTCATGGKRWPTIFGPVRCRLEVTLAEAAERGVMSKDSHEGHSRGSDVQRAGEHRKFHCLGPGATREHRCAGGGR